MHQQIRLHLLQLQFTMERLDLWQVTPPNEQAFLSEQPFALDTMTPTEWLQWIFIPRMHALIEAKASLPKTFAITPYLEEALKDEPYLLELCVPLSKMEQLLNDA